MTRGLPVTTPAAGGSSPVEGTDPVLHQRESWEWFGSPLHFCAAFNCHFHLGTLVGPWVVSTVGEYVPDYATNASDYENIGSGRKYETFVFRATGERCDREGCHCDQPEWSGSEIDSEGYNERGDAQRGHLAMCERWATKPEGTPARWDENE